MTVAAAAERAPLAGASRTSPSRSPATDLDGARRDPRRAGLARRRPAGGVRRRSRRSRPSRTCCTRRTSTCAPSRSRRRRSSARHGPTPGRDDLPEPAPTACSSIDEGDLSRPGPVARGDRRGRRADEHRRPRLDATRIGVRAAPRRRRVLPGRRPVRAADPRALEPGRRPRHPGRRPARAADHHPLARRRRPDRALHRPDVHRARRRRRGDRPRGARGERARASPTAGQSFLAGTLEVRLGRDARLERRQPPGAPRHDRRVPASQRRHRRGRDAPLGARPARFAPRPQPGRQPPGGRPQLGRAGRDRVRRRATSCST